MMPKKDVIVLGAAWVAVLVVPWHLNVMSYIRSERDWNAVDPMCLGNVSLIGILLTLFVASLLLRRPYLTVFFGCHRKPERSFARIPLSIRLCERCTGIFIGVFMTLFVPLHSPLVLLCALPLFFDGVLQAFTRYESGRFRRLVSGLLFAPAFVWTYSTVAFFAARGVVMFADFFVA